MIWGYHFWKDPYHPSNIWVSANLQLVHLISHYSGILYIIRDLVYQKPNLVKTTGDVLHLVAASTNSNPFHKRYTMLEQSDTVRVVRHATHVKFQVGHGRLCMDMHELRAARNQKLPRPARPPDSSKPILFIIYH